MKYTVDYFIKKFKAIPEERWTTGKYREGDKCCALGHCGITTEEADDAFLLFEFHIESYIAYVNDGKDSRYQQPTPKQRILAALHDIKKLNSEPEVQECDATEVEKSVTADTIKTTNEFSPVTFEKITELIPELSNS